MAIPFSFLDGTAGMTIDLPPASSRILDIGRSNVYDCEPGALSRWLKARAVSLDQSWIDDFAEQSCFDVAGNRINGAFLGDLCARIGIGYTALDIMDAPGVLLFDLNRQQLPDHLHETFDLVINCGTTEHVLNQFNAFNVIHDAVRPYGEIFHFLPVCGWADHGYVTYNERLFFDLAGYNDYDILQIDHFSQGKTSKLLDSARNYAGTFPILRSIVQGADRELPDIVLFIRYGKRRSARFCAALDTATSIAPLPRTVLDFYDRSVSQVARAVGNSAASH